MLKFREMIVSQLLRPQVIHQLPGRLRIHIPGVRYIPKKLDGDVDQFIDKLKFANGVRSVDVNLISGNVLIYYDKALIDETSVINWISKLYHCIIDFDKKISTLSMKQQKILIRHLSKYFNNLDTNSINLEQEEIIPVDVWKKANAANGMRDNT
ncbi:hypothetical protein GF337_05400 [candidate division KSB1 bacterium]|nr:hypothetical protein [candidate division KSB1 bacterium]